MTNSRQTLSFEEWYLPLFDRKPFRQYYLDEAYNLLGSDAEPTDRSSLEAAVSYLVILKSFKAPQVRITRKQCLTACSAALKLIETTKASLVDLIFLVHCTAHVLPSRGGETCDALEDFRHAARKLAASIATTSEHYSSESSYHVVCTAFHEKFVELCTSVWLRCGKSFRSADKYDTFIMHMHAAVFGDEPESSSWHLRVARAYRNSANGRSSSRVTQ